MYIPEWFFFKVKSSLWFPFLKQAMDLFFKGLISAFTLVLPYLICLGLLPLLFMVTLVLCIFSSFSLLSFPLPYLPESLKSFFLLVDS